MMMPRLGSIGATEMRLSSALAEYWSCLYHWSHRKRVNSGPKQITIDQGGSRHADAEAADFQFDVADFGHGGTAAAGFGDEQWPGRLGLYIDPAREGWIG